MIQLCMASDSTHENSLKASIIVLLLILHSFSIGAAIFAQDDSTNLDTVSIKYRADLMEDFDIDFGYEMAGQYIDYDNLSQAKLRQDFHLSTYFERQLVDASSGTPTSPDVAISNQHEIGACWSDTNGMVYSYSLDLHNNSRLLEVDSVTANPDIDTIVSCSIAVKNNGRQTLLYANGSDIKAAQIAMQSPIYPNGDEWHTRTILEGVNATNIELSLTPNQLEWGAFRDDLGRLHSINYTGAFWDTSIIHPGPISEDFELEIDPYGRITLLYNFGNSTVLHTIENGQHTSEPVHQSDNLHSDVGLTMDGFGMLQMFSTTLENNISKMKIQRSLLNQKNQFDSIAMTTFEGQVENATIEHIFFADFNADGFDDMVYSEPNADSQNHVDNGQISIHYGSESGLSSSPDLLFEGEGSSIFLGQGLAVGDFNGDGFSDLSIGSPGFANNNGIVEFSFGSQAGLSENLAMVSGISNPATTGESYGSCLEYVEDLNSDGYDDIIVCSIDHDSNGDNGLVELFFGGSHSNTWVKMDSPNQLLQGSNYGQSVSADGDLNGDGFVDLVIGNTGDLQDSSGFSSVEIRYGSATGFDYDPDSQFQSTIPGTLFGYKVQIINDLNGDGFDELFISEPYNTTNDFNSGNVWIFYGNSSGINNLPDNRIYGGPNQLLGLNFVSAGDSNQDGYNDFLITRRSSASNSNIDLYLGSQSGFANNGLMVRSGELALGQSISNFGDSNADGLSEFLASSNMVNENQTHLSQIDHVTRTLWDVSEYSIHGEISGGVIQSSADGSPTIVCKVTNDSKTNIIKINLGKGSQGNTWISQNITNPTSGDWHAANFELTSSGEPIIFYYHDGIVQRTYDSYTALESQIGLSYSDITHLSSSINNEGNQFIAYYSPNSKELFLNINEGTGWVEQLVASNVEISTKIELLINSSGQPKIVYFDDLSQEIIIVENNQQWSSQSLSTSSSTSSGYFTSMIVDDEIQIATILDDGLSSNLTLLTWNGTHTASEFIALETDISTNFSLIKDAENTTILATVSSSGLFVLYEKAYASNTWNSNLLPQPSGFASNSVKTSNYGNLTVVAINSENNSLFVKNNDVWNPISNFPVPTGNDFILLTNNSHIIVIAIDTEINKLTWNSLEYKTDLELTNTWHTGSFSDIASDSQFSFDRTQDDSFSLTAKNPNSNALSRINLYLDQDSDFIFDGIDDLVSIPNQWLDSDGDGYGDNEFGPLFDSCLNQIGQSSVLYFGCLDTDNDGYDDLRDNCNTAYGTSWLGRLGCSDFDQDGWVDWTSFYPFGDIFIDNWKQAFDSDGDSYGDNHGPDCCETWYDQNAPPGDEFPFNERQYTDFDGDGYGDNSSDFITGDACKFEYGTSYRDRLGCIDTDGDGSSDPTNFWNSSLGADLWPADSTQWADSDGDGFGDNGSKNATSPDYFPNNIAAAQDSDEDGYPDSFTDYYNGSNSEGLQLDGCPLVAGNSSNPYYGCLDSDGDNYRDIYTFDINPATGLRENQSGDAFPFNSEQWTDTDGDGFGDFQGGDNADMCPQAIGVINGTLGIGCPLIDGNDDDGDFVINEEDLCPNTQLGLVVNLDGCALNQVDSDSDGVSDADDVCPSTFPEDPVDSSGCSQVQREIDTDSDGIYDYLDSCENTPSQEVPDEFGCSTSQKDTDGDGVTDDTDVCPDTGLGYPVLADGCIDESALEFDWDSDGYSGQDDLFPFEETQWFDSDSDGYGDNILGFEGDQCPNSAGNSTEDRFGCLDADLDGWSDPDQDWAASPSGTADAFTDDITQWRDLDGDGYGDNSSGNNPDLCPTTNSLYKTSVDLQGCANNERDSDDDGLVDSLDNCPDQAKGPDGYADGCPLEKQQSSEESTEIFGLSILNFVAICAVVVVLFILLIILRRRGIDEDWYEEDDDLEDFYEEEKLNFLNKPREKSVQSKRNAPMQSNSQPPPSGPTGGPPSFATSPKITARPPSQAPDNPTKQILRENLISAQSATKKSKKVKKGNGSTKKVKRAVVEPEPDIFEKVSQTKIDAAVKNLGDMVGDGDERQLLMYLQEEGWNAPQSRAIINMAKKEWN